MPSAADFDALLNPSAIVLDDVEPVFVVGCVRSGTSAVARALREGAEIPGFREGNVLSMMQRMLTEVARQYGHLPEDRFERKKTLMLANVDQAAVETYVVNYFAALYAKHLPHPVWYDKSPESFQNAPVVRSCPTVLRIFPKARFIFCLRRGIEQVMSCLRKFPRTNFRAWCHVWRDAAQAWGEVRDELGDRAIVVHQHEMAMRPDVVAERIQGLLGLAPSRREAMEGVFRGARVEQTQFAQDSRFIGIDETPWTPQQREIFVETCGGVMAAAGFSLEGRLVEPTAPMRLFHPVKFSERAVETENVANGAFRKDGRGGIVLVPNCPGEPPAEVRYLHADFVGQDRMTATVEVEDNGSDPVDFHIRIETSDDRRVVAEMSKQVRAGEAVSWTESFPPVTGAHDIVISTRLARGAFRPSPAVWRDTVISIAT